MICILPKSEQWFWAPKVRTLDLKYQTLSRLDEIETFLRSVFFTYL
jgi:hypothetical protein